MSNDNRPLSPHLGIFHWKITMLSSILHRATGIVLVAGSVLLALWLCAAAAGESTFNTVNGIYGSWFGQILLFGWTLVLFYHLCNGIRHLIWDMGIGFSLPVAERATYIVFAAAIALTVLTWILAILV